MADVRGALALVAKHPQLVRRRSPVTGTFTIEPPGGKAVKIRKGLWLGVRYTLEPLGSRFTTVDYRFRIQNIDGNVVLKEDQWLVRWEYHPKSGPPFPHVHVSGPAPRGWSLPRPLARMHVPVARSLIEDAVECLITDFDAARRPRAECTKVLAATRERFEKRRTWLMRSPT